MSDAPGMYPAKTASEQDSSDEVTKQTSPSSAGTPAMQATMSSTTFFGILELVEQVLLQLPFLEIVRCKRINKTIQALIKDSIHLRRATFRASDGQPVQVDKHDSLACAGRHMEQDGFDFRSAVPTLFARPVTLLNVPRIVHACQDSASLDNYGRYWSTWFFKRPIGVPALQAIKTHADQLFHLFISQPPASAVLLRVSIESDDHPTEDETLVMLYDRNGVTMGLVHEIALKLLRQLKSSMANEVDAGKALFLTTFFDFESP